VRQLRDALAAAQIDAPANLHTFLDSTVQPQ
jgi:hypothetical protein